MKIATFVIVPLLAACSTPEKRGDTDLSYEQIRSVESAIWQSGLTCKKPPINHMKACPPEVAQTTQGKCIDAYVTSPSDAIGHYFRVVIPESKNRTPIVLAFRQAALKAVVYTANKSFSFTSTGEIEEVPDQEVGIPLHDCL